MEDVSSCSCLDQSEGHESNCWIQLSTFNHEASFSIILMNFQVQRMEEAIIPDFKLTEEEVKYLEQP